jgi:PAS domain S-box-containing protein
VEWQEEKSGTMRELVLSFDWSNTPLGPLPSWPQSLRTTVRILLSSRYAMWMAWGPDLTFLYNDTYGQVTLGKKHPWALGKPTREVWKEIWGDIGPRIQKVLESGEATWDEGLLLFLERSGYPEETYHTFSYSPLQDDGSQLAGMLCVVTEETDRVIGERRLRFLRLLSAELGNTITEPEVLLAIERSLLQNDKDLPFALVYLQDEQGVCRLAGASGLNPGDPAAPLAIEPGTSDPVWPGEAVLTHREPHVISDLRARFPNLPTGFWNDPPNRAFLVPLIRQKQESPLGFLVVGLNPSRPLDADYRGFIDLIAGQIAGGIASARAFEQERRRAEALAEIDRAKTAFFTNISHEFRTPLTLMLGPLEELTSSIPESGSAASDERQQLTLVHRNARRLLKLVNALLEFSRIEAGRANVSFQLTDLSRYTAELASAFDSATGRAGLDLNVSSDLHRGPVAIDREMWEKIVLNLLSNAFKFTLHGSISVLLKEDPQRNAIQLLVADTGIGIRKEDLDHLFERFHRIQNAGGRSFEGTGIGLAMVRELVGLHGGTIQVESEFGRGTTFTVTIPRHTLAAEASTVAPLTAGLSPAAADYVEEALGLILDPADLPPSSGASALSSSTGPRPRLLLADDNADMRAYLQRLLAPAYDVEAVTNGRIALDAATANPPDLVVTDVMMPELNGFELLSALRSQPSTDSIPVIMVSARAGEESHVEGLQAGADDYLVKPFSARELLARVRTQLLLRQRSSQFETLVNQAPIGIIVVDSDFRILQVNPVARPVFGDIPNLIGSDFGEIQFKMWNPRYAEEVVKIFRHTLQTGEPYSTPKRAEYRADRNQPEFYEWRIDRIAMPQGGFGLVCYFRDISAQVKAEDALRKNEKLAAVGRLASTISHEINNPLESVTNLLYIIRNTATDEALLEYVTLAEQELRRASEVVRHSLKFHRQTTSPELESISTLLSSTLAVYEPRLRQVGVSVHCRFDSTTPILCYSSELRQVFANLIGNALDACGPGRSLFLKTLDASHPLTRVPGVRVTVADNGTGMSPETRQRLFEPFFTTKGINGTGLGLWVSSEILSRHGATVSLKSRQSPRSGTVFSIFFQANPAISSSVN